MEQILGDPFSGPELERLKGFLAGQGISYDEGVEHSVVLEDDGRIVATGSVQANVVKCVAVDGSQRGRNLLGQVMTHLVGWLFAHGVTRYFGYTKPANERIFRSLGMYPVVVTDDVLLMENRPDGLERWLSKVARRTSDALDSVPAKKTMLPEVFTHPMAPCGSHARGMDGAVREGGSDPCGNLRVGAIVMNANPFTLGHRYLVREACAQVDLLHVFVLSSEQAFMPAHDRVDLVRQGTADLPGVLVHEGGPYLVSPATFPTYFMRDRSVAAAYEANCLLDVALFRDRVAPALGITARFVGSEPLCPVTATYNRVLARELPLGGIDLVEVPRLAACLSTAEVVSASKVRELFEAGELEAVRGLVPEHTYDYLRRKAGC